MNRSGNTFGRTLWTITLLFWATLFVLTHIPQVRVPRIPGGDKTIHTIAYFALACVLGASMWFTHPSRRAIAVWVLAICLVYGAFDELTQPLVGRYCEFRDFIADTIGASAACLLLAFLRRMRARGLVGRADRPLQHRS